MTLVPYSPWLCLTCGHSQPGGSDDPRPCCPDRILIRIRVDEPDPEPVPEVAA